MQNISFLICEKWMMQNISLKGFSEIKKLQFCIIQCKLKICISILK